MATPGGYWRPRDPNKPMAPATTATPAGTLTPDRATAPPPPAALGIPATPAETPEQRAARTGVNVGGAGAVSGQVAPPAGSGTGTSALAALSAPSATTPGGAPAPGTPGVTADGLPQGAVDWRNSVPGVGTINPGGPTGQTIQTPYGAIPVPQGDTATMSSALTAPGGAPGTATRTSAVTNGGANNTGTTSGKNLLGPLAGPVGQIPIVGGLVNGLTTATAADLSPALNAQRAAFGISDDLDRERFDYRPGDAPSMNLDSDIRQRQLTSLDALTGAANGTVQSAAERQMQAAAGRGVAASLGQARALGGRSAGGAARAGTMASADILARNNIDGAQLRASEQANARNALSAALGATRGQDTDISGANLRAQLDTNQLAEQHRLQLLEARLKALGIGTTAGTGAVQAAKDNAESANAFQSGVLGTIGSAFGLGKKK